MKLKKLSRDIRAKLAKATDSLHQFATYKAQAFSPKRRVKNAYKSGGMKGVNKLLLKHGKATV